MRGSSFARSVAIFTFLIIAATGILGQTREKTPGPDVSVAGIRLGDRDSAKKFLDGYQFRTDGGVPTYYFYNSHVTTVLKLTGASFEDPYFINEIEVYKVGQEYQAKHFVLEKMGHFLTESGIHVGFRQSGADIAFSLTVGIPGVVGDSITHPKYVIKKVGEPTSREKDGEEETLGYRVDNFALPSVENAGRGQKYTYTAQYRFYKNKLNRFSMKILPVVTP